MSSSSAIGLRHCAECMCETCEREGTGYFAQRAVLAGDSMAAERLSPAVFSTLAAQLATRRAKSRRSEN